MRKYSRRLISFIIILSTVTYIYGGQVNHNNQYAFQEISKDYIESIDSEVISYNHISTGAHIIHIKNKDPNKVFAIAFKTPVHDNTGVNHIVEHAVFTGSEKYKVKDVFFEMKRRSPNTFMNASTAADMTIYPFSTRNHKDYNNLLDVYLDAVFSPNLQKHPYGFQQEGGVVYNEMKGASVVPRRILAMANRAAMFPDTMYIYNAGGSPKEILGLSYDQFKETHRAYYVPSNSCAFIYGDVDIKTVLDKLDNYYNRFEKQEGQDISQKQEPFKEPHYYTDYYPAISKDENYYISTNFAVGEIEDVKLQLSMRILMDLLIQYETSPLREVFRQKQASKTLSYDVDSAIPQPMYSIIATDVKKDDIRDIEQLINGTLEEVAKEGFHRDLLKMAINNYEIRLKQKTSDISKGIDMAYSALYSWGHGVPPLRIIEEQNFIKQLKKEGNSRYFQKLLQTHLLDNNHRSQVVLAPDENYITKMQEEENKKTGKDQENTEGKEKLRQWQQTKELGQDLPQINIKDIDYLSTLPKLTIKESKQGKKMYYLADTNDLIYMDLYFDTSYIPQESLNELFLFSYLVGQKEKDLVALYTGGLECSTIAIPKFEWYNEYDAKLKISICMEKDNIGNTFKILDKITHSSTWDDQWLLAQIRKIQGQYEEYFTSNPLDLMNIMVGNTQDGAIRYEYEKMVPFYKYICEIEENYGQHKNQVIDKLKLINKSVFNKDTIALGATLEKKNIKTLEKKYKQYVNKLNNGDYLQSHYDLSVKQKRQGFPIASDVQYIVWGGNYKLQGGAYDGALYVLANILNSEYLLKNIRVKNGAYGAGLKFNPYGHLNIYTYQDPKLLQSLKIIEGIPNYIRALEIDTNSLDEYKIGAFSKFEQELGLNNHPKVIGGILQQYYLSGLTSQVLEKVKREILSVTIEDIKQQAEIIEKLIQDRRYSIAGSKNKLLTNIHHFDIIQSFQ